MTEHPIDGFHLVRHALADLKVTALRDKLTAAPDFRRILQELSQLVAYEALRDFEVEPCRVETPLGPASGTRAARPLVLVPVLRAGLAMADGILRIFPTAAVGHIGMFRDEKTLEPVNYFFRLPPDAAEAHVLLLDPMLATGNSLAAAARRLKSEGIPRLTCACIVASRPGVTHLRQTHPDMPIYGAALDEALDARGYITPGLGDAGDRIFGT
ncbi:MAG: uracil phosphoribosyltransferase [Chthoniobacterales bacterium]|jgi:uracil phosphoribosyltransferase